MYKFIKELRSQQSIDNEDIISIENKFDFKFPDILREYYLKYNGAKINLCCFEVDEYEYEISKIIPLKYGSCSLEKVKENDMEDGFIEESLVPIANNRGGDYYYWDKNTEKVYVIYGDDIDNSIFICNSISELFEIMNNFN